MRKLSSVETLDNAGLDTVAGLARKIKYQQDKVERLDRELKDEKQALLKLTDEDLPSTMADLGLSKFSLDDGSTVEVKPTYGASILVKDRPAAYEWLRENGFDDIIKNVISASLAEVRMTKPVRSTRSHLSKVIRQTRTKVFMRVH